MKVRGKSNIEAKDVLYYKCVAAVASDISKRIADELTPTFIVQEAIDYFIDYFSSLEQYEVCKSIKNFFDSNPSFFVDISRAEWFGEMGILEKK
jgi:hypothetical protein